MTTLATLPWFAWLGFGWGLGFIGLLIYSLMHAATVSDEWMEEEIPTFLNWEVQDADLVFERIVHRPVEGTVLAHE